MYISNPPLQVLSQSGKTNDWSVYFDGCMKIVNSGFNIHRRYAGDCAILLNWVRYHKTLYKFSIKHWQQRTPQMELMAKSEVLVSDSAYDIDLITVRTTHEARAMPTYQAHTDEFIDA
jgi:hypothetical protein